MKDIRLSRAFTKRNRLIIATSALTAVLCHPDFMWRFPYWIHAVFATATASLLVGLAATLVESRKSKDSRAEAKSDGREGEIVAHDNWFANETVPPSIAATPKSDRKVYHVPTRFGLGTMVLFTVFFALLSLCLRLLNASPSVGLVILGLFAVIGGSQVVWQDAPRAASAWAGAVSLPLIFTIQLAIQGAWREILMMAIPTTALGALLGYCVGALIAGMFLLMDGFTRRRNLAHADSRAPKHLVPTKSGGR